MTVMIDAEYVLKIIGDQLYGEMSAGDEYLYDHKTYDDGLEWCFELIRNVANNTQETILVKPPKWVSVKDRLPGHRAMYITCDELNIVEATMFDGNEDAVWNTLAGTKVTHWMPLPEPPEVEDEAK